LTSSSSRWGICVPLHLIKWKYFVYIIRMLPKVFQCDYYL
jgi:hypothetical protein